MLTLNIMCVFLPDESKEILFVFRERLINFSRYHQTNSVEEREMTKWVRYEA